MSKSSNFFGQPIYGQLIKSLDREKIVEMSRKHGGEKYVKSFDGYTHLLTMLYAVIQRFDSLREIEASMTAEVHKPIDKLPHPLVGSVEDMWTIPMHIDAFHPLTIHIAAQMWTLVYHQTPLAAVCCKSCECRPIQA